MTWSRKYRLLFVLCALFTCTQSATSEGEPNAKCKDGSCDFNSCEWAKWLNIARNIASETEGEAVIDSIDYGTVDYGQVPAFGHQIENRRNDCTKTLTMTRKQVIEKIIEEYRARGGTKGIVVHNQLEDDWRGSIRSLMMEEFQQFP